MLDSSRGAAYSRGRPVPLQSVYLVAQERNSPTLEPASVSESLPRPYQALANGEWRAALSQRGLKT